MVAFSHVQFNALCFPHEQVALVAQRQAWSERPQQVDGRVDTIFERAWWLVEENLLGMWVPFGSLE